MTEDLTLQFADLLTTHQKRLHAYIVSLLGDSDSAWDVLQETNRVLLEKRTQFEFGTSFINWALTVAQFQTMAWLRDKKRDRMIVTPEIVEMMVDNAVDIIKEDDLREQALKICVQTLSDPHRELIHSRYVRSEKLADLSEQTGRTENSLKQMLFRIRQSLAKCVEQRLEIS